MPRITGSVKRSALTPEDKQRLTARLRNELAATSADGPVIFEVPLEDSDKMDVVVVWEAWSGARSEERTSIIRDAYAEEQDRIALPLGVTYSEAIDQQVLPYAVIPMTRRGEVSGEELTRAMLDEGGFAIENGKVDLRFPMMALAETAHRRLTDKLPRGYWSIVQSLG